MATPSRDSHKVDLPKYSPRAAEPGAAVVSPTTPKSAGRFSGRASPNSGLSPRVGGGTTLYVSGVAKSPVRGDGNSSVFRSGTTIGDAHIKNLNHITQGPFRPAPTVSPKGGTAAFRSTSPSDRDSHIRDVSQRFNSTGGYSSGNVSPGRALPSASYRSGSPIACAHVQAMPKPTDASYGVAGAFCPAGGTSASYRSTTSIADAHIKALPKFGEGASVSRTGSIRECTSPFKSTTSIGDAHIKAVPKPVDTQLAYQE